MILFPCTSAVADSSAGSAFAEGWQFWLFALEEYKYRMAGEAGSGDDDDMSAYSEAEGETDQDVRLYLDTGGRSPGDRFGFDAALGLWADVDGSVEDKEQSSFASYRDNDFWLDVYTLSAEYNAGSQLEQLKGGRHAAFYGSPLTLDGATLLLAPFKTSSRPGLARTKAFIFGGRLVHFYETDAEFFEDYVASAGTIFMPLPFLRLELDYRYLQEDTAFDDGVADHNYGTAIWYRLNNILFLKLYYRGINDEPANTGLNGRLLWQPWEVGLDCRADFQLATLREINEQDLPFYSILGESLPRARWSLDAWKGFTTGAGYYAAHLGWAGRQLLSDDETAFNRNYGKAYAAFDAVDIGVEGPFVNLAVEYHFTTSGDESKLLTLGGAAGYDSDTLGLRGELGSYYQQYKYTYYVDVDETEEVRTYFGSVRYNILKWLAVKAMYEFEQFDRDVHTITLSLQQRF